jgi:hypothetical protein
MARYRCYFLGSDGQLVAAETINTERDEDAVVMARELFARKAYAVGFELREGDRQVSAQEIQVS